MMRKTRFVCVSDTHAYTPSEAGCKLPPGDVLIHAGDLTTHGSLSELRKTLDWIVAADYEVKIIIAGNHDITLDPSFYDRLPAEDKPETSPQQSLSLLAAAAATAASPSSSVVFLNHQSALIRLTRPGGPNAQFKVFGSPYSPIHSHGSRSGSHGNIWSAFGYESTTEDNTTATAPKDQHTKDDNIDTATPLAPEEAKEANDDNDAATNLWDQIPSDTDIVITHTPPYALCDSHSINGPPVGCKALRRALGRVRPSLAVCGHVHEARGCIRLLWEGDTGVADDMLPPTSASTSASNYPSDGHDNDELRIERVALPPRGSRKQSLVDLTGRRGRRLRNRGFALPGPDNAAAAGVSQDAQSPGNNIRILTSPPGHAVPGQPCSGLEERVAGKMQEGEKEEEDIRAHRQETCLVNAAILATSFPHRGGKQFNAPVVVDLELPTWREPASACGPVLGFAPSSGT